MTNIYFDGCAVVAIATLILALIVRKLIKGRNNVLFLIMCVIIFILALADRQCLSYQRIRNIPEGLNTQRLFFQNLYFLLFSMVSPVLFLFVCSYLGIWHKVKDKNTLLLWWLLPFLFVVVLLAQNVFTRNLFYIDGIQRYNELPAAGLIFLVAMYFHVLCLYILYTNRRLIPGSRRAALYIVIVIDMIAIHVELISAPFRIAIFAMTVLAVTVAISVQRPEEMMDYVVGLQNYNAFLSTTKNCFETGSPTAFLLIRFDNFKSLRSSLGFENYLLLLKNISDKIEKMGKITASRTENYYLNNGSFAIVGDTSMSQQILDAGRVITAYMLEPIKIKQMEVMLDARVCLVECPEDISNETSMLNFVNSFHLRLPAEKRVIVLSKIAKTKDFRIKSDMDTIINRGIAEHSFEMYYQPIYSTKSDNFTSAEALIRLKDKEYGFVSPALFIPAAEESGAIHEIGDYVIEEVCRFIGSDDFKRSGLEYVELNLSVAQCIENDLFEKIDGCMKKYGVKPEQLNLEITETSVDYDPETTDKNIEKLSKAGISFSLDDYGTGYSNIKRVVSLPLSIVKLDKTLVDEMDTPLMWIVISNTVRMLKRINKKILVEGIEDKRALMKFMDIGCDYIQGFYFSKPLPREEFLDFLAQNNY
ncbi:MAG: EAL domain-containing protein [Lachnospiraceae bacterium]|nr:EAL domain-containing protein [Lachnospiraceae bacterium]